jgi:RimJ/RimL family protein N-acetyltransferase
VRLSQRPAAELLAWGAPRIAIMGGAEFPADATAMGIERQDGSIAGVVAFHDWQPSYRTLQVSAVSESAHWLRARAAWSLMFRYAFEHVGAAKIWSATPRSNTRAMRLVIGLGLRPEAVLERHFGRDDAVISRMFADEWSARVQAKTAACARSGAIDQSADRREHG